MILEVYERLALLDLLPKEDTYAGMKSIRRAREVLSLTSEEAIELEFKATPDESGQKMNVFLNPEKALKAAKEIPLDEYITNKIRTLLADLEKKGKLNDQTFSLFEKFVVTYQ